MKKVIFISILVVSLLSARQIFVETNDALSVKASGYNVLNVNDDINENSVRNSREEITLVEWDFESDDWFHNEGWVLTSDESNSGEFSYNSPNDETTLNSSWNLVSDVVSLPQLGEGEVMQFDFFVYGDTPDTDGDDDGYLEDYYQLSIMDLNALAWHASDNAPDSDGASYWCADESIGSSGGYLDEWMQYLDTPPIVLQGYSVLECDIKFEIEDEAGASVGGSCTDGWDAANVRISADGGATWELLEDPGNPYDFDCGYGWIYNDGEYEAGGSLNHVAAGWGGSSNGWISFSADLSAYVNQEIIVRFAFGSDPAYSTIDQDDMTGFQVDNIAIHSDSSWWYTDDADDSSENNMMIPSGEVWEGQFYDYFSCDDERPGACGEWQRYTPGSAFNGNVYQDISHFAGKDVLIKFSSRYDDNDDGGVGAGIFVDDFRIYKESSGNYAAPSGLTAEAGDSIVDLSWNDMNLSGTDDFSYHNGAADGGYYMVDEEATGFAGTAFEFAGASTVHHVEIYRSDDDTIGEDENGEGGWPVQDFDMEICAYGTFGSLYDTEKLYDCIVVNTATFDIGWNMVDIPDWEMTGNYIISYSFNHFYYGSADFEGSDENSYFAYELGNGDTSPWQNQSDNAWGITANISYESANVTYNVYRDEEAIASGLDSASFGDETVINDIEYTYAVSATYPDGEESGLSDSVTVRPESESNHEEAWDDGSAEEGFNSGGSNTYIAVRYTAIPEGETIKRVKWYQMEAGGAFYIKFFEDNNGVPGEEFGSYVQVSGNDAGWNERDFAGEGLTASGDFWVGTKNFSSTKDWGLDTDSVSGNSMYDSGTGWRDVDNGNLMLRVVLDCGDNCPSDDPCADAVPGDTNGDGGLNVLDVVGLVAFILGNAELSECGEVSADFNGDGTVNVLDVVSLVQSILGGRTFNATSAMMHINSDGVDIAADGHIGAVQLTLSHDHGFELELTESALVSDYKTDGKTTTLIVVAPDTDHIFTTSDIFEVSEALVVNSDEFIDVVEVVSEFSLSSAYPNPFNPTTTIDFSVAQAGYASVKVYNLMGQVVDVLMDGMVEANTYNLTWDAQHLASGVYMIKAQSNDQVATQKVMLLK